MYRTRYWQEIVKVALKHNLDPILIESIVVQESGGNADAFRFDKNYWNRTLKQNKIYSEKNPRRVSSYYGLMQIFYPVAVERGFPPDLPPELLFVPETALDYGCRQMKMLLEWATDNVEGRLAAVASYSGGRGGNTPGTPLRNASYARNVQTIYLALLKEHTIDPIQPVSHQD